MKHDLNCSCQPCLHWFSAMMGMVARGRCHCGQPIDSHQMTTRGEVVACPKLAHA